MYYPTSRVSISSAGWYRVFKWVTSDNISRAAQAFLADIAIATSYSNTANVVHRISLLGSYAPASGDVTAKKIIFANEVSKSYSNTNVITKIRYTTDGSGNGYIDIYYNDTSANYVKADIVQRPFFLGSWSDMGFASVASAPSGETVRAEYTFDAGCQCGIVYSSDSVTTTANGYVNLSSGYPISRYMILSATTTRADSFIRITGSTSGQWIRVMKADGTPVASETITINLALLKLL